MPLFMDRHYIEGATHHAIRNAHEKDLDIQDKYSVKFLTYWFDELRCTAFCLVEAPIGKSFSRLMLKRMALSRVKSSRWILRLLKPSWAE